MTAPQAQQPSEWVEKALALADNYGATFTIKSSDAAYAELRAALTQREEAFAALLKALQSFVDDIIPNDPSDPLWVTALAALALARKGDGNE